MKRFLLFSYDYYCPSGGCGDFREDFDSHDDAMEYIKDNDNKFGYDVYEVVDTITKEVKKYEWDELFG